MHRGGEEASEEAEGRAHLHLACAAKKSTTARHLSRRFKRSWTGQVTMYSLDPRGFFLLMYLRNMKPSGSRQRAPAGSGIPDFCAAAA